MQRALDTHDTVLRALLARYYGYEVTTEGDSFTMAFHDPVDAVHYPCSRAQPLCALQQLQTACAPQLVAQHTDLWLCSIFPCLLHCLGAIDSTRCRVAAGAPPLPS